MKDKTLTDEQSAFSLYPSAFILPKPPSILVACIGNIFLGDDGFGCEVAHAMQTRRLPENVRLIDYGIRGYDLAYALVDGFDITIFVDAVARGELPGTLFVIEPDLSEFEGQSPQPAMLDAHTMNPLHVLRLAHSLGARFNRLLLVGCEPETLGGDEGFMGLSAPVAAAIGGAVEMLERLIERETQSYDAAGAVATL